MNMLVGVLSLSVLMYKNAGRCTESYYFIFFGEKLVSILSRKMYVACSAEIFLSEIIAENQNCTISVAIFSVYISKCSVPFRNRVIPNAEHWQQVEAFSV